MFVFHKIQSSLDLGFLDPCSLEHRGLCKCGMQSSFNAKFKQDGGMIRVSLVVM